MYSLKCIFGAVALAVSAFAESVTEAIDSRDGQLVERDGTVYKVFEDLDLGTKMEFVTNSGVCEMNKGVTQYSGYFTVAPDQHMWFWFFEARNNPETAPISTWFNGGPGCSSMIGLFQENGPCKFVGNATEPINNPNSWNEFANMLYVDQPIGVGFSYGISAVDSTATAAPVVWKFLQAFFKKFPKYKSRDFGVFTESYGGHYGPGFADYIEMQNEGIRAGKVKGQHINMMALGVNNGFYDAAITYKSYYEYAFKNKYNQIINKTQHDAYQKTYYKKCLPKVKKCTSATSNLQDVPCLNAEQTCAADIEIDITLQKDFDVYDVREPSNDPFPPQNYMAYLNRADIKKKIGARKSLTFKDCRTGVALKFLVNGDEARSYLPALSRVTQRGTRVLLWHGDADYICNYRGGFATVNAIKWSGQKAFNALKLRPFKTAGKQTGLFKTRKNLSWFQVFEAGHEVPYYQPEAALQVFRQTMSNRPISST